MFQISWPPAVTRFLQWVSLIVSIDLPALPAFACLYHTNYRNTFLLNAIGPPVVIGVMVVIAAKSSKLTRHQVWRYATMMLFLVTVSPHPRAHNGSIA